MERRLVQPMVTGHRGVIGQHVHRPVLVDVDLEIELVQILHHPMVVYPALVHPLKLMVLVAIPLVVCSCTSEKFNIQKCLVCPLGANPAIRKCSKERE